MTCTLIKDNTTKQFIDKGAISPSNKILDNSLFNYMNKKYSQKAQQDFNREELTMLFSKEDGKAIPNTEFMAELDKLANPELRYKEEFEKGISTLYQTSSTSEPYVKELDDYLLNFVEHFGVQHEVFDELKSKLGIDAFGATDVLNKLIWYTKDRNAETVPEEVGHMLTMLMGERHPAIQDLLKDITYWEGYKSVYKEYMPIYDNEKQVKIEAIGKLLAKSLVKNYKSKTIKKSILDKIIDAFLNELKILFKGDIQYSEKITDKIAMNVLTGNKSYIATINPSNQEALNYQKSIDNNKLAKHILDTFGKNLGGMLVGSLAVAGQKETIYRSNETPIHDLDFAISKGQLGPIQEELDNNNAVALHSGWAKPTQGYTTYTYLIPKKGYTIKNEQRDSNGWIRSYELHDENGNLVDINAENVIATDFFAYDGEVNKRSVDGFASWNDVFLGKLELSRQGEHERMFQREKDQQDYVDSNPLNRDLKSDKSFIYYHVDTTKHNKSKDQESRGVEFKKIAQARRIERGYEKLFSRLQLRPDTYTPTQKDSLATTEEKIERLQQALDAVVVIDTGMESSGKLLGVNHPLTKANGKPTIVINPNKLFDDTIIHEFGHLYVDLLGGLQDNTVAQAVEQLKGSKLWAEVAEAYPELSGEALAKEVLATAIGFKGNEIYNAPEQETIWQQIKAALLNALAKMFNYKHKNSALEKLATEIVKNKVRVSSTQAYNTLADQERKFSIPKTEVNQDTVDDLFTYLTNNFKLDDETHTYKNNETGEVYNSSVSTFAKNMMFNNKHWTHKGDYTLAYDEAFHTLTENNYEALLAERKLPYALDKAMENYFAGNLSKSQPISYDTEETYWHTLYSKEIEDPLFSLDQEHLDVINEAAKEEEYYRQIPALAGTQVHEALEDFIKDKSNREAFPESIIDTDGKLLKTIKDVIETGEANGSKFYTEQMLFSEAAKKPGTADLIEITKDGKFRIYDFKTMRKFKDRLGNDKTDYQKYIYPGYVNQLIIYATMLEDYNIKPADRALNIIAIETDTSQFLPEDPDKSKVIVTDVENKHIDPTNKYFATTYKESKRNIVSAFRSKKKLKEEYNVETKEDQLNALALKIQRGIKDYEDKTNSKTGKFTATSSRLGVNLEIYGLGKQVDELIGKHNELILFKYVDNMRTAMNSVYQDMREHNAMLSSSYVQNVDYLVQMSSFIPGVKKFLDNVDDTIMDSSEIEKLRDALEETDEAVRKLKDIHVEKTKELAINTLVENSRYMEGAAAEYYEMKARNEENLTDKEAIAAYVHEKLQSPEVQEAIDMREYQKWNDLLHNGYTDIRQLDYLLSDPGMSRSQFVQVVKNILDKVDNDVRVEIDRSIPEIVKWRENLGFNVTGDPAKVWDGFFETAKYIDLDGKAQSHTHASVIPEFTSKYREARLRYQHKLDYLNREVSKAYKEGKKKKIEELEETRAKFVEEWKETFKKSRNTPEDIKIIKNPAFEALSKEKQEALRYIHKKLQAADNRLSTATSKKLVREVAGGAKIYNLPKMRKTMIEAAHDKAGLWDRFKSGIKDFVRPPADEDELNMTEEEEKSFDSLKTKNTDIVGDPSYDVPVFYRNELEDPTMQSLDIPTLLAMNEETTIAYEQHKMVEADIYMITGALKNSEALKTDALVANKVVDKLDGYLPKNLKSSSNFTLKAVQASINNRFYKRSYMGAYSKKNYQMIKAAEALSQGTSTLLLAGNFRSASMTGIQGTIYRIVEGIAGEHFNMNDVKTGSSKAYGDIHNILKDSQEFFPKSKTALLIRRFGLETQYKALVNKFVQDNFATKNMDQATLFSLTSLAETMVTASLMYTLMNNIKVMNEDGDFINAKGQKVAKKDAMSLDEAYTVVDGVLKLNENVAYTEKNLTEKISDEASVASTQISGYIRSVYADLFGQYNQDMKSVAEMHIAGKLMFSMRKWLPRGMHRRWTGILNTRSMSFEDLKKEENWDKRFFSQDQGKFQEGYYATGARYMFTMIKELKALGLKWSTMKDANGKIISTMNGHERANLVRLSAELSIMALTFLSALVLAGIAAGLDDEDDKRSDHLFYLLYLIERLKTETFTFINPGEMIEMATNPAASMSVITKIIDLIKQVTDIGYDDDGNLDFGINDRYERGNRKGELKITKQILGFVPAYKSGSQFLGILGLDSKESIEDTYKYTQR